MADLGNIGAFLDDGFTGLWSPMLEKRMLVERPGVYTITGVIRDANGEPAARKIRLYRRSDGALIGRTESDATTGAYTITSMYPGEHTVLVEDSADDPPLLNNLVGRVVPAIPV